MKEETQKKDVTDDISNRIFPRKKWVKIFAITFAICLTEQCLFFVCFVPVSKREFKFCPKVFPGEYEVNLPTICRYNVLHLYKCTVDKKEYDNPAVEVFKGGKITRNLNYKISLKKSSDGSSVKLREPVFGDGARGYRQDKEYGWAEDCMAETILVGYAWPGKYLLKAEYIDGSKGPPFVLSVNESPEFVFEIFMWPSLVCNPLMYVSLICLIITLLQRRSCRKRLMKEMEIRKTVRKMTGE